MQRIFAALLLAAMIIGGTRRQTLAALKPSWRTSRPAGVAVGLSQVPLRFARDPMPEAFVDFFKHVEKNVPIGAPIAVVVPPQWDSRLPGYSRFRIEYLLAGHSIVMTVPILMDLCGDSYVAAWRVPASLPNARVLYRGSDGVLIGPDR